jgi:Xaa-Pro aminopeptidase
MVKKERILKIQKLLAKNEALVTSNPADLFYLIEMQIDLPFVITKDNFYLLVSPMLEGQFRKVFKINNLIVAESNKTRFELLKKKIKVEKVILEDANLSLKFYNLVKNYFKNLEVKSVISQLRQIKDSSEILYIKTAIKITKNVLYETKRFLNEGVSEIEVKNFIIKKFLEYNVEPSFKPIVAFDENTSYPHHIPSNKKLKTNSLVLIDLGCKYKGYCSDITRMFNVEKNKEVFYLYTKLKELQQQLLSMCKPQVKVKDIDNYAREFFNQLGIKDKYLHSTGHGIGIEIHEPPRIAIYDNTVLKQGMVITIEPGIYFEGKFGLRIEDDVLIKYKENEVLTN